MSPNELSVRDLELVSAGKAPQLVAQQGGGSGGFGSGLSLTNVNKNVSLTGGLGARRGRAARVIRVH